MWQTKKKKKQTSRAGIENVVAVEAYVAAPWSPLIYAFLKRQERPSTCIPNFGESAASTE